MKNKIEFIMRTVFELSDDFSSSNLNNMHVSNWDSLNHMNLIVALEDEFNVSFDEDQINEMISLELIELIIKENKNEQ